MTEETPMLEGSRPPRRRIGLRVLLFASLALNLVIIGVVGGAILNFSRGEDHPRMVSRELGLGPYFSALDQTQRRALNSAARAHRSDLRAGRKEWKETYAETLRSIRAEPFESDRFRAALIRQSELAERSRQIGFDVMVAQVEAMSPQERNAFADKLASRSGRQDGQRRQQGGERGMHPKPKDAN